MKHVTLLTAFCIAAMTLQAQIAINTDGSAPHTSAALDVQSTNKGMLIPRLTTEQRGMIAAPATGLLVFDDDSGSFWFYNGMAWTEFGGGTRDHIRDADGNTQVMVEKNANEDKIRFDVAGVEAMQIAENGRIGIGTAAPAALFHLHNGALLYTGTTGSTPVSGAGTRMMWIPEKGAFRAGHVTSSQWDAANIGARSFVGGGQENTASGEGSFVGGGLLNTASGVGSFVGGGQENTASHLVSFVGGGYLNTASGYSSFVGGGIVNMASGYYSFVGGGTDLLSKSYAEAVFGRNNVNLGGDPNFWNSDDALFVIGNGSSITNRSNAVTVRKNGNTGIGTAAPLERLHVVGNVHVTGDNRTIFNRTNSSLALGTNNTERMRIAANGNIGIATTDPTQKLDVDGNARFRNIGSEASVGALHRTSDGTLTTSTSDVRLKTDIHTLTESLDRVLQLRGVSYLWKNDPDQGERIGFIAQEVAEVVPALAFTNQTDGYMGVHYAEITAVIVEAIKEQQSTITNLQNVLEHLQYKSEIQQQINDALRAEIDEVRRKL